MVIIEPPAFLFYNEGILKAQTLIATIQEKHMERYLNEYKGKNILITDLSKLLSKIR